MLLVRHAESEWNRVFGPTRIDPGLPDPSITAEGREAARIAARSLLRQPFSRIVVSPYRRTLQTAMIFAETLALPVTIDPQVRERCAFSCDQGSSPRQLEAEWPTINFRTLPERWWGTSIESMESLGQRGKEFRAAATGWSDGESVLVVTHWGFIRCLTGAEVGNLATVRLSLSEELISPQDQAETAIPHT